MKINFNASRRLYATRKDYCSAVNIPDLHNLEGEQLIDALEEADIDFMDYNRAAPSAYRCNECGNVFYTRYISKYEQIPACPICGCTDMYA